MKYFRSITFIILLYLSISSSMAASLQDEHLQGETHSGHHTRWMFSVKYMTMPMSGNLVGSRRIGVGQIFNQGFIATPLRMDTNISMFGAMYVVNQRLRVMVMMPYIDHNKAEEGVPIYQNLGGPQLKASWYLLVKLYAPLVV